MEALTAAEVLLDRDLRRDATSRLYYAAFHAARAALATAGEYAKSHAGQVGMFIRRFGDAPILGQLLDLRGKADYGEPGRFTAATDELRGSLTEARGFVERCRKIVEEAAAAGPDEPDPAPDL